MQPLASSHGLSEAGRAFSLAYASVSAVLTHSLTPRYSTWFDSGSEAYALAGWLQWGVLLLPCKLQERCHCSCVRQQLSSYKNPPADPVVMIVSCFGLYTIIVTVPASQHMLLLSRSFSLYTFSVWSRHAARMIGAAGPIGAACVTADTKCDLLSGSSCF